LLEGKNVNEQQTGTKIRKMVTRKIAIALGIICFILIAAIGGVLAFHNSEMVDKENTISSLNSQVTTLRNQTLSDDSLIASLHSQIVELENQLTAYNSTAISYNATIISLQSQITTLQTQVNTLEYQNTELNDSFTSLQNNYTQLNQAYTSSFFFTSFDAISSWGMPSSVNAFRPQIYITYPAGFQEYAQAILQICNQALADYGEIFDAFNNSFYDRPQVIYIFIYTNCSDLSLYTIPQEYTIYSDVRSINDMGPPQPPDFIHNVYGFIHELGHITFLTDNDAFDEGWAMYSAHYRVVPQVYSQLGDSVWPQPYNYSQTDGVARFLSEITNSSLTKPSTSYAAAKLLYTIDQKYGTVIFKEAMDLCHPTLQGFYEYPVYSLSEFKNALVDVTNDTSLLQLFQENGF
jgi:chaperonin cofactor prefoldin